MGCYMSTPDNKVYITEGEGKDFVYATASCQGWRREQEDAEDCIPYYDDNASLFILCDGHGGAEVAKYTVENYPKFLKDHHLYKEGKYKEALYQSFIDFDALLRTEKVMERLNEIAMCQDKDKDDNGVPDTTERGDEANENSKPNPDDVDSTGASGSASTSQPSTSGTSVNSTCVVDDVDTETLRREAQIPLKDLMDQYPKATKQDYDKKKLIDSLLSLYNTKKDEVSNGEHPSSSGQSSANEPTDTSGPSSSSDPPQGPSTSEDTRTHRHSIITQVLERYFSKVDEGSEDDESSDDSEFEVEESDSEDDDEGLSNKENAESTDDDDEEADGDCEDEDDSFDDLDKADDDDDEEIVDADREDDTGEQALDDDDDDDDKNWTDMNIIRPGLRNHTPGMDSGCTVVVVLIKDNEIYVASAGDSRCILVNRDGNCKAMSFDHKPEDKRELDRIRKAGGRVTDGRVNGGLNLSRAFADFTYKCSRRPAEEQMITPCPDIHTCKLDPANLEYVFLACDGIWNSVDNEEVAAFISTMRDNRSLVDVCVELFRYCIAPRTDGDGTGCDNMTSIIARFPPTSEKKSTISDLKKTEIEQTSSTSVVVSDQESNHPPEATTTKRSFNDDSVTEHQDSKKRRTIEL